MAGFAAVRTGVTAEMISFSKRYTRKTHNGNVVVLGQPVTERDKQPRDRSLNGKARIRARRARHREGW